MEANKLMIGDWVCIEGPNCYQIDEIRKEFDEYRLYLKDTAVFATESEIEPIPLTAEILEKNGFERLDAGYRLKKAYLILSCSSREDNPKVFWLRVSYSECRIEYVHQLQHALRVVWRNDIADNFKVG